jgi:hypothetical protein
MANYDSATAGGVRALFGILISRSALNIAAPPIILDVEDLSQTRHKPFFLNGTGQAVLRRAV